MMKLQPIKLIAAASLGACVLAAGTAGAEDIFHATLSEEGFSTGDISFDDMAAIARDGSASIFDVRSHREYSMGHIPGAIFVGRKAGSTNEAYMADPDQISAAVGGDLNAPIVLYCNGPFCGKSKRVANALVEKGFRDVRRFQLGDPVWRALGGAMIAELEGLSYIMELDGTAAYVDARTPEKFASGTLPRAINIPADTIDKGRKSQSVLDAKESMALPMEDHNTRLVVFGEDPAAVETVAAALRGNAFHNVLNVSADNAILAALYE